MSMTIKILTALSALLAALAGGAIINNGVPLIEPPGLARRLAIYLTSNSARTHADHELPELRTRVYPLPPERALELVTRAANGAGWRIADLDDDRNRLHAVVITPWFRFQDDVRITLEKAGNNATAVQVTSQSRIGRADFGANIAHVMELHRGLDALANTAS